MLWGKTFNPRDYLTPPTPFTVRQPKPEIVPEEIVAAIAAYEAAIDASWEHLNAASAVTVGKSREALKNVILKHLRGEA